MHTEAVSSFPIINTAAANIFVPKTFTCVRLHAPGYNHPSLINMVISGVEPKCQALHRQPGALQKKPLMQAISSLGVNSETL